jgi:anti-anti-sigma factor
MLDDHVGHVTIDLTGEFDIATTAELRDSILTQHRGESHVLVDLTDVTFMDSSALRALLDVRNALAEHRATLTLANPTPNIRRLLTITGTAELFGVPPA